jgi:putative oxidoreductase
MPLANEQMNPYIYLTTICFPMKSSFSDIALLLLRVLAGGLMAYNHGWGKLTGFGEGRADFYDWLGLGMTTSLVLAVFAEFFCGVLLSIGLFTRLAAIPLIITMCVAIFGVHWGDPFKKIELPLIYLVMYIVVLLAGPGKYSLDTPLMKKLV